MKITQHSTRFLIMFIMTLFVTGNNGSIAAVAPPAPDYSSVALNIADNLLGQQNADGVIPDAPGSDRANVDSNMEYALIGMAAAYWYSHDPRYLDGLERGIRWLANREEMADPFWRGSWFYAYSTSPPYAHLPESPGKGIADVRGVDSTSTLFVYLLYLHSILTGTNTLAVQYKPHALAALDFVLAHNQNPKGFFYSSWQFWKTDKKWHLWKFRYAADQADVYLGMQAGSLLYGEPRYGQHAAFLRNNIATAFFMPKQSRYALGMDEDGSREVELEGFNGIFPQGYLPWVFRASRPSLQSSSWLSSRIKGNGSLICFPGDPAYSLSVSIYGMAEKSLGHRIPTRSFDWLVRNAIDHVSSGVRDSATPDSEQFSNVAGFTITAFLGFPTLLKEPVVNAPLPKK
jgi:hypothetical protein